MYQQKPSQTRQIQDAILSAIGSGMVQKDEIYTKIVADLNVPRPTVRRACKDLVSNLEKTLQILKPVMEISSG